MDKIGTIEEKKLLSSLLEEEPNRRSFLRESWNTVKVAYILGITGFSCFETLKRRTAQREAEKAKEELSGHMEKCDKPEKEWREVPGFNAGIYTRFAGVEGKEIELKIGEKGEVWFRQP